MQREKLSILLLLDVMFDLSSHQDQSRALAQVPEPLVTSEFQTGMMMNGQEFVMESLGVRFRFSMMWD